MAAQAAACAPIEDATWRNEETGEPIAPEVIAAISSYMPSNDGASFTTGQGIDVPVQVACDWYGLWQHANSNFRCWCSMQAITEDISSLERYFGPTATLLDFDRQSISWPTYFETALETYANDAPDLITMFDAQIAFENRIGYDFVGCPFLFPSRAVVLDLVGGERQEVTTVANGKIGKHAKAGAYEAIEREEERERVRAELKTAQDTLIELDKLEEAWATSSSTVEIGNALVADAADSYVTGEYDAMAVYEAHRRRVKRWADEQAEAIAKGLSGKKSHEDAVSRMALGTMVSNEATIMREIARRTSRNKEAPRRLDESRMKELRAGSRFRP